MVEPALFLVHYHEIALKGRNRRHFEQILAQRLRDALGPDARVNLLHGRILVEVPGRWAEAVQDGLGRVFGVAYFARVQRLPVDFEKIAQAALARLGDFAGSFRVSVKRANKRLPFTSPEAERQIGALIVAATGWPVRLRGADVEIFVEFYENKAWLYTSLDRTPGPGGLPVGASGKVVVLASGGIDSPVAAWRVAKRGARPVYVHFHSYPHTSLDSLRKTEAEIEILSRWHGPAKLYVVPLAGIQEEIFAKSPERYRTLLYRRFMYRIAARIAGWEKAGALVTGDALGQVASQTLENMRAVQEAVDMLVLRPLVGMDKTEVIAEAQAIGTYDISIQPQQDCCSFLEPKRPATKSTPEQLRKVEAKLDVKGLVEQALERAERRWIGNEPDTRISER
ncbi:tRNA uracil 4-sulfurtransferase ThiI [Oceanithermus sp.]